MDKKKLIFFFAALAGVFVIATLYVASGPLTNGPVNAPVAGTPSPIPQKPPDASGDSRPGVFGASVTLAVNATAKYDDGLSVTLVSIDDSRCKPDVQCIWAGELAPVLSVSGGAAGGAATEVRLGTATATQRTAAGYAFTLTAATEATATLIVTTSSGQPTPPRPPSPEPEKPPTADGCRKSGCSGQVCSDEDVITDCQFRPEYACYREAKCERQPGGVCGWTPTPELAKCLANPPRE